MVIFPIEFLEMLQVIPAEKSILGTMSVELGFDDGKLVTMTRRYLTSEGCFQIAYSDAEALPGNLNGCGPKIVITPMFRPGHEPSADSVVALHVAYMLPALLAPEDPLDPACELVLTSDSATIKRF